ncbi:MAG: AmmeMemoRadiSam system radical SAM enzyme, partial [Desulfomonilia bacterium]|nr:AmmeMemoRadiSam system radical SAM enzyme [Desulfomonilia bacterium]
MKEARFWTALSDDRVRCMLCAHRCTIPEGKTGICAVRRNVHGVLYSLVWGRSIAANVDPIEKKPLYHFLPATRSFSIATVGCNFRCAFCQNSDISQFPLLTGKITGETFLPEDVVDTALSRGCRGVSYTYTEPTISLEYVLDTAKIAHTRGLLNTMITNGYTATDIISGQLKGLIDGANIDLKAFTETFYTKLCSARLAPVLDAIRAYHDAGIWIEVTTLVIPGENDSKEELTDIASFICSVSPDIPWHLSRYYPRHHYTRADPTPVGTLEAARDIGLSQGLKFVYTGNVMGHAGEHTYCPGCGEIVISRRG